MQIDPECRERYRQMPEPVSEQLKASTRNIGVQYEQKGFADTDELLKHNFPDISDNFEMDGKDNNEETDYLNNTSKVAGQ